MNHGDRARQSGPATVRRNLPAGDPTGFERLSGGLGVVSNGVEVAGRIARRRFRSLGSSAGIARSGWGQSGCPGQGHGVPWAADSGPGCRRSGVSPVWDVAELCGAGDRLGTTNVFADGLTVGEARCQLHTTLRPTGAPRRRQQIDEPAATPGSPAAAARAILKP